MREFILGVDDILRARGWRAGALSARRGQIRLLTYLVVFTMTYGAVMGSYGAVVGRRNWNEQCVQMLYSACKVPTLVIMTCAITLPSFFIINTLLGMRDDFHLAVRAIITTQVALAIILCSLAPLTLFFYVSGDQYDSAVMFNAAMFGVASIAAQVFLRRHYRELIQHNARHAYMIWMWIVLYAFVGIQMGWVLRPFIGYPGAPIQFFRDEVWDNAYVVVLSTLWDILSRFLGV